MTPLKFRIWNKAAKAMYPTKYFALRLDGTQLIAMPNDVWHVDNPDHTIVMQSTGLFDKAGKEIFDGDVLRNAQASVNVVHWYEGCWCLRNSHAEALPLFQYMDCEVIGNIYDNPDLLPQAE